jgi:diguanylate cyclase (GGDEF)-like protein
MTPQSPLSLLLVTGDALVAGTLESHLSFVFPGVTVRRAQTVSAAVIAQSSVPPDAVLADLAMLDDSDLVDLTRPVSLDPPPVFGILRQDCPLRTAEALQAGVQECLVASDLTPERLARSLRQGIERQRLQRRLADLALRDELTGLYNRRGFFALAEHQRRQCLRTGHGLVVVQADVDGLKEINDTLGHQAGDQAIAASAAVLRCTFRESDIVARLGGDEFAAVAVDADEDSVARILERLEQAVDAQNVRGSLGFRLSLSVGAALLMPLARTSLAELLAEADRSLYREKRREERQWRPVGTAIALSVPLVAA